MATHHGFIIEGVPWLVEKAAMNHGQLWSAMLRYYGAERRLVQPPPWTLDGMELPREVLEDAGFEFPPDSRPDSAYKINYVDKPPSSLSESQRVGHFFRDGGTGQGAGCYHDNAVSVEDLNGERVAALCPDCDVQLPAAWSPERWEGAA